MTQAPEDTAARRRSEILDAAEELIAVHGFDALRLRDVASRAGVSIGMIQHYFATRDELLRETIRRANEHRAEEWENLRDPAGSAPDQLRALLEGAIDDTHRCTVWIETCAAATRHPEVRDDVRRTQEAWRETLRRLIRSGMESEEFVLAEDLEDIVALLVGLIDGFMLEIASGTNSSERREARLRLLRDWGQRLLGATEAR